MIAASTLVAHFWHYYFLPVDEPWWKGAVWGNVIAIAPSAPVILAGGVLAYYFHKRAMEPLHAKIDALAVAHQAQHEEHIAITKSLLDALDPDTDGGISDVLDRLDPGTPGGIGEIREQLERLAPRHSASASTPTTL